MVLIMTEDRPQLAYLRVADSIAAKIESGEYPPGSQLPNERDELAAEYQVSYGTVRRAMQELRARGLVQTVWGRGNVVRDPES